MPGCEKTRIRSNLWREGKTLFVFSSVFLLFIYFHTMRETKELKSSRHSQSAPFTPPINPKNVLSGIKGGLLSATPGDLLDESLEIITLRGEFVSFYVTCALHTALEHLDRVPGRYCATIYVCKGGTLCALFTLLIRCGIHCGQTIRAVC